MFTQIWIIVLSAVVVGLFVVTRTQSKIVWNQDEYGYREHKEPDWLANFTNVCGTFE